MSDDAIVRFIEVEKSFDGKTMAVADLNLDIRRGEFLTLLGPSGSGKTTTLMMLAGFETPSAGEIYLDGRSVNRTPTYKRNIGIVFQNYALFPHLTIGENIAFPLRARRLSRDEIAQRVNRALAMVRLDGLAHRRPNQVSGGQQQRAALARALVFEPKLVLMDEPLGALDRQLREMMQYEIKQLHRSIGVTVLYVTHDQDEALTMADRIAVLNAGRVQQLATASTLYDEPQNAFVAQFVGESNRLSGVVRDVSGDSCVVDADGLSVVATPLGISPLATRRSCRCARSG
jgi:putative spermidine/putrescine transport system ATP-binding protein